MTHLEKIKMTLAADGIDVEEVVITKNGIPCTGIRVYDGNRSEPVCPIVYYSEQETLQAVVDRVRKALDAELPEVEPGQIGTWEYVKEHAYLCVQRRIEEETEQLTTDYLNLQLYIRVNVDLDEKRHGSYRMTRRIADHLGVSDDALWGAAEVNSSHYCIRPLFELLGMKAFGDEKLFAVLPEANGMSGATSLYYPEVFRRFCQSLGEEKCYILPSSTEEVIVMPGSVVCGSIPIEELRQMVSTINREVVDPVLQLDPEVYVYQIGVNAVQVAVEA